VLCNAVDYQICGLSHTLSCVGFIDTSLEQHHTQCISSNFYNSPTQTTCSYGDLHTNQKSMDYWHARWWKRLLLRLAENLTSSPNRVMQLHQMCKSDPYYRKIRSGHHGKLTEHDLVGLSCDYQWEACDGADVNATIPDVSRPELVSKDGNYPAAVSERVFCFAQPYSMCDSGRWLAHPD